MTAGIVATGLLFWPAPPFFLFMHGKDITIPKGAEVPTFVNGNFNLDTAKFRPSTKGVEIVQAVPAAAYTSLAVSSTPAGADICRRCVPNEVSIHVVKKSGFQDWTRPR
jgi:hypothetical protein